jgi:small-conductance mechanosensitive channel
MLRQFYFKLISPLLMAAAFLSIFLPVIHFGAAFAAEPPADAVAAENPPVPAAPAVTPAQARQALAILQDEKKRAELAETLNAIMLATEIRTENRGGAAPAPPATPPAQAKAPAEAPIELTEGGLVAQLFDAIGKRLDAITDQLRLTAHTLLEIKTVGEWWQYNLGNAERRSVVLHGLWKVAVILGSALLVDWLLRWALARARRMVEFRAAARQEMVNRKKDEAAGGTAPSTPPSAASMTPGPSAPASLTSPASPAPHAAKAADRHLSLLRRFPFALAHWLLELVPLAGFVAVAIILLNVFGGRAAVFYSVTLPLIGAYSTTRIVLSVVHLMASPLGQGLRLIHISDGAAAYLNAWMRRIIIVAVFGSAIAEVALQTGAIPSTGIALSKLVGLVVHIMLLIMMFQSRKDVAAAIRGAGEAGNENGPLAGLRGAAASAWPFVATIFIIGTWLLWSVGAENGFQRALEIFGWSAVVVVAGSLISIFALGAIDRAFIANRESTPEQADQEAQAEGQAVQSPYHRLALRAVSLVIAAGAFIALLQIWGVNTLSWFQDGSVGRRLAAALATIAVTCALAFAAWEALNTTMCRRIERWTEAGDTARAARLRTLAPMLRTTLLFGIGMVVLLAALDQLGISIGPLVAGASIIGVALGFGSQKLVQDFITGIFLLMENAIQVGDAITVADVSGVVEHLSIRTVRLRAGDGALHVVPFSSVSTVTNTNRGIGNASIRVSVKADSDIDEVFEAIRSVGADMRADPVLKDLILADADIWGVDQVDGATITVLGQIRTVDRGRWPVQRGFNRRILQRFRESGIQFMNPQERKVVAEPPVPAPAAQPVQPPEAGAEGSRS